MAAVKAFNTGKISEKIIAMSTYDGSIITELYQNPSNKKKINRGAAYIIKNYFDNYMDQRARQDRKSFHHVYDFDRTGQKDSRLFAATILDSNEGAVINYRFTKSNYPNRQGYPFPDKASVMEEGKTLIITPKRGQYLQYQLEDGRFVKSKKSIIENPGGDVAGNFEETFNSFMSTQADNVLEKFGFFRKIERAMLEKRRLMIPRINSGMVLDAYAKAKADASQISGIVSGYYV